MKKEINKQKDSKWGARLQSKKNGHTCTMQQGMCTRRHEKREMRPNRSWQLQAFHPIVDLKCDLHMEQVENKPSFLWASVSQYVVCYGSEISCILQQQATNHVTANSYM